jgi:hypothetical protein
MPILPALWLASSKGTIMKLQVVQNAYVTADLVQTCKDFHEKLGIGPFILATDLVLGKHKAYGMAAEPIILDAAFAQSGELNIEVIQIKSKTPSAFADFSNIKSPILHHVAYFSDDYEYDKHNFVSNGFEVASEFVIGEDRISFIDTRASLGHMI